MKGWQKTPDSRNFSRLERCGLSRVSEFFLEEREDHSVLTVTGDWTVHTVGALDASLRKLKRSGLPVIVDVQQLQKLDTAGAYLIDRTVRESCEQGALDYRLQGQHPYAQDLLSLVTSQSAPCEDDEPHKVSAVDVLARIGHAAVDFWSESYETMSFMGQATYTTGKMLLQPHKIRWTSVVSVMEEAGLDALPIISFLSFFVGVVIAFIGATMLQQTLGSTVFTVELVGWAMMREFGVVLTGILLAGRTNSSFTAQIGSMKMRQEVDAMKTLGLDPIETLVVPRVIAMLIMTPFLAFGATMAGLFGGLIISWTMLDISPILFITRIQEIVVINNFWVGMAKPPVFGLIVALVACRQGLDVGGDVQSLGKATTASVVHAIFLIIVTDAIFAMIYMELDI